MIIPRSITSSGLAMGTSTAGGISSAMGLVGGGLSAVLDFTQSSIPLLAIPYTNGSLYSFIRASTVWCPVYDTATQSLKWVEIPANIPPMPGMRWDANAASWSPYDEQFNVIPASFRKGYWYLPQATNSVAYSRDITGIGWRSIGSPTIAQNATGFDGTANKAWTITDSSTSQTQYVLYALTTAADTNTHTVITRIAKDNTTSRFAGVRAWYTTGKIVNWTQINTKTGEYAQTNGSTGTVSSAVIDDGAFWVLVQTLQNDGTQTALNINLIPASGTSINVASSAATGSAAFDQAEIRLNTSFYDGSPIVTNGNDVTRLAGDYRLALANHNQSAGMVLCELEPAIPASQIIAGISGLINLSAGSNVLYHGVNSMRSYDGTLDMSSGPITFGAGTPIKAAVRWSGSQRALVTNGNEVTGTYDGLFQIGYSDIRFCPGNGNPLYIKSLKYYTVDRGTAWIQGQQA